MSKLFSSSDLLPGLSIIIDEASRLRDRWAEHAQLVVNDMTAELTFADAGPSFYLHHPFLKRASGRYAVVGKTFWMIGTFSRDPAKGVSFLARHLMRRRERQMDTYRSVKLGPMQETTLRGCAVELLDGTSSTRFDFTPYFGHFDPIVEDQAAKIFKPLAALSRLLDVRSNDAGTARYQLNIASPDSIDSSILENLLAQTGGRFEDLEGCVIARVTKQRLGLLEPGCLVRLDPLDGGPSYETTLEALYGGFALLEATRPATDVDETKIVESALNDVIEGKEFILRRTAINRLPIGNRDGVLFDVWRGQVAGNWHNLVKMLVAPSTLEEATFSASQIADVEKIIEKSNLDPDQRQAVIQAALTPHMHVIQGPPGCGKTTVIAEIVRVLHQLGKTILVVGPTHSATDEVIRKLKRIEGLEVHRLGGENDSIASDTRGTRLAASRKRYETAIRDATRKFGNLHFQIVQLGNFIENIEAAMGLLPQYHVLDSHLEELQGKPLDPDAYRQTLRVELEELESGIGALEINRSNCLDKVGELNERLQQSQSSPKKLVPVRVSPDPKGHRRFSQDPPVSPATVKIDRQRAALQLGLRNSQKDLEAIENKIALLSAKREQAQWYLSNPASVLDILRKEKEKRVDGAQAERDRAFPSLPFDETTALRLAGVFRTANNDTSIIPSPPFESEIDEQDWISGFLKEWREKRLPLPGELEKILAALNRYLSLLRKRESILRATEEAGQDADIISKALFAGRQIDCSTIYAHKAANRNEAENDYDVIIADEASKITEADFVNVAPRARRWIFVGDTRQLPPYIGRADVTFVLGAFSLYLARYVLPESDLLQSIKEERESLDGLSKVFGREIMVGPWEDEDDPTVKSSFLSRFQEQNDGEEADPTLTNSPDDNESIEPTSEPIIANEPIEEAAFLLAMLWNQQSHRPKIDEAAIVSAVQQLKVVNWKEYAKALRGYMDLFRASSGDASSTEKGMVQGCQLALDAVDRFLVRGLLDRFSDGDSNHLPTGLVTQLSSQRRMTETLASVVRAPIYKGQYRTASTVSPLTLESDFTNSLTLLDTSVAGQYAREEEVGTSYRNVLEANWFISTLETYDEELAKTGEKISVLGLSFYKAQVEYIGAQVAKKQFRSIEWRQIGTVDSYQGQEADLVIVSFCRTGIAAGVRGRFSKWLQDVRRLNVAFTRARRALVIIGHAPTLEDLCGSTEAMDFYENLFRLLRDPKSDAELRLGGPHKLYKMDR